MRTSFEGFQHSLTGFWPGAVSWNVPMAEFCTMRAGGGAWAVIEPENIGELLALIGGLRQAGLNWRVMGRGSNLLVPDEGFAGALVVLGPALGVISLMGVDNGRAEVEVEAGCGLARLLGWCAKRGLSGLEFAAGIPGSIGGAVVMNAGALGGEMRDVVIGVSVLSESGELIDCRAGELDFGYRVMRKAPDEVVVRVRLELQESRAELVGERLRKNILARRGKQPQGLASAGSVFKNPPGGSAGQLIDQAGLKGLRVGGAEVSRVHANFIVNSGGATAGDVITLMNEVADRVQARFGIRLEPEIHILEVR